MIKFLPERPQALKATVSIDNKMVCRAFDLAYEEYCRLYWASLKQGASCDDLYNHALRSALIVLSVYLSYAAEGILYA